ncbi:MAG: dihydrodipicolinate synthase family protein [Nitrososphaerota archaeon]|nr:dihydrodipicolinate synthase family protein [Nitrososphaerota archaeon]
MKKHLPISGVITALITPFDSGNRPSLKALKSIVSFQLEKGIHGVFPLGTTGMGLLMNPRERMEVAEAVIAETAGKVPVIVHTGAMDTATTVELSRHAEKAGADAISCIAPFFFRSDDATIVRHFEQVSKAVTIPVFAYNNPKASGVNISLPALQKLSGSGTIYGLKDSSRDFLRLVECVEKLPDDFVVLNGTENYALPSLVMGVRGMISAVANIIPEYMIELYDSYKSGDFKRAIKSQRRVNEVKRLTEEYGLGALFTILQERGVECGAPRAPVLQLGRQECRAVLNAWKKLAPE